MVSGKSLLDVNNSMPLTVLPPHFAGVMTRPMGPKMSKSPTSFKKEKTTHSPIWDTNLSVSSLKKIGHTLGGNLHPMKALYMFQHPWEKSCSVCDFFFLC